MKISKNKQIAMLQHENALLAQSVWALKTALVHVKEALAEARADKEALEDDVVFLLDRVEHLQAQVVKLGDQPEEA